MICARSSLLAAAAALATAAATSLAAGPHARAAVTATAPCAPIHGRKWHAPFGSRTGTRYQWSVIGRSWTCKTAKPWVLKLVKVHPAPAEGLIPLKGGPKGYHCYATQLDKAGYAFFGVCFKGTFKYPGTGFQWAGT